MLTINSKLIIDPDKTAEAIFKLTSTFKDQYVSLELIIGQGKHGSVEQGWVVYCTDLGFSPRCLCPLQAVELLVNKL